MGQIVADFISTGVLNGELIKAKSIEAESLSLSLKNKIDSSIGSQEANEIFETNFEVKENEINSKISNVKQEVSKEIETTKKETINLVESKLTKDSLTTTIGNYYTTTNEVDGIVTSKGYQTSSQVQQTVDQLQVKFSQSGGYNLIRNGGFENGLTHWTRNGSPTITENQIWQNYNGKSILIFATSQSQGIYQHFPTTIGKTYSYSFYAQAEKGEWYAGIENRSTQSIAVSPNDWRRYIGTFVATATSHTFVCYAHGGDRNVYIDNIMVCEGTVPSVYTPHPSEVYDGITTIDKDGITVSQSNIDTKTTMNASGFYINKNGQGDVFKVDANGLAITGKITSNEVIMANGGMYTGQAVRGTNTNGFVVVGSSGDTTFRSDAGQVYLQTNDEVKVTAPSNPNTFKNLRANNIYVNNDFYATRDATVNRNLNVNGEIVSVGSLTSNSNVHLGNNGLVNIRWGYGVVRVNASDQPLYLQCHDEVKCTKPADPSTYTSLRAYNLMAQSKVYANGVALTSSRDKKKNIELYEESALQQILQTKIYRYHLLDDLDEEMKRIGIILQEAPVDAIDIEGVGVDLYQMVTMTWKAIQELKQEITKYEVLEKRIEILDKEIKELKTTL